MCPHTPPCPEPKAPDREAAKTIISHPEQGWSLLCNGVVVFEDTGELLPDGNCIAPHRPTDLKLDLHVAAAKRSPPLPEHRRRPGPPRRGLAPRLERGPQTAAGRIRQDLAQPPPHRVRHCCRAPGQRVPFAGEDHHPAGIRCCGVTERVAVAADRQHRAARAAQFVQPGLVGPARRVNREGQGQHGARPGGPGGPAGHPRPVAAAALHEREPRRQAACSAAMISSQAASWAGTGPGARAPRTRNGWVTRATAPPRSRPACAAASTSAVPVPPPEPCVSTSRNAAAGRGPVHVGPGGPLAALLLAPVLATLEA